MAICIGKKIKEIRKYLKMTQEQVALPEMTKSMLSHIENGYANPSMKNLQYIAQKLNKPVSYFLEEDTPIHINYKENTPFPNDTLLKNIKTIDEDIKNKNYSSAKDKILSLLTSYNLEENNKCYIDILSRLITCHINLKEYIVGEDLVTKCCKLYSDNMLYTDAARVYMKLLNKPIRNYQYKKSLEIINTAYDYYSKSSSKDVFLEIQMLISKPAIYFAEGDFEKAISACKEAISICNENSIFYCIDEAYRIMSIIYLMEENYSGFLDNIIKAEKYSEFTSNKFSLVKIYHNYAKYQNIVNNPTKALEYLNHLKEYSKETSFYYYIEIAKSNYLLGNYDTALNYLSKITFEEEVIYYTDCIYLLTGKIYKGLVFYKLNNLEMAIFEIEDAISKIKNYTNTEYNGVNSYAFKELKFAYENLSEVYSSKGDFETAYKLLKKSYIHN